MSDCCLTVSVHVASLRLINVTEQADRISDVL